MLKSLKKIGIATVSVLALSACGTTWNGENDVFDISEQHPIAVDSQVVTLTLDVDPTLSDLSEIDKARLRAFANNYLRDGHGPITVTAPSGTSRDGIGQEQVADVRALLNQIGVPYTAMTGATYRTAENSRGQELVVSYTHYVTSPSPCGLWTDEVSYRFKNKPHPNYGCADQNNLAAMISDPRDLVNQNDPATRDATARVRAINAFREGEQTSRQRDNDIETNIAN